MQKRGFTIVELLVVIALIGLLATITIFGFGTWRERTATTEVTNALITVAGAMNNAKNFSTGYPTSFPSGYDAVNNVVLELASSSSTSYCINGYSTAVTSVRMSISSTTGTNIRNYLCAPSGSPTTLGGTVPTTPRGVDLSSPLSSWTVANGVTYNTTSGVLSLATANSGASATVPLIRVDSPASISVNGLFYATQQSPNAALQPKGGWHMNIFYYGSDTTTAVTNTAGYTGNGCAQSFTLNSWSGSTAPCSFAGGPNVIYVKIVLYAQYATYASPDLQIKQLTVTTQ